jgi:hypothetical protein
MHSPPLHEDFRFGRVPKSGMAALLHPAVCQVKQIVSCRLISQFWRRADPVRVDVQSTELPFRSIFSDSGPFLSHHRTALHQSPCPQPADARSPPIQQALPLFGVAHIARTQLRRQTVPIMVEEKSRVGADRLDVSVVGADLLPTVNRGRAEIHVEHDALGSQQRQTTSAHHDTTRKGRQESQPVRVVESSRPAGSYLG